VWTGGLVDPTVGAAMAAIGYTRDYAELPLDPRSVRASVARRWRSIRLSGRLLTLPRGVVLDLNGVVKSLAVDDALSLVREPGFVSAGGDLATNSAAAVGLPRGGSVTVRAGGLATSGTRRRWSRGGDEQHHLVDPTTGLPSRSPWFEVTVAASSCLRADVAAKAAFLLGADGPGWLDGRALPGRFVGERIVLGERWRSAVAGKEAA
jgi:FAD:protein FMN transferase